MREKLRNPSGEFHLEVIGERAWNLYPVTYTQIFTYSYQEKQPGEPVGAERYLINPYSNQPLSFILRILPEAGASQDDGVINPAFQIDFHRVMFPVRLFPHQYMVCDGDGLGKVYDINWNLLGIAKADSILPDIPKGSNGILFSCDDGTKHIVEVKFKFIGEPKACSLD